MSEDNQVAESAAVEETSDLFKMIQSDPGRAEEEIKKLRNENSQKVNNGSRDEFKRLQELESTYKTEQEEKLKEEGRYKELLEKQAQEMEALRSFESKTKKYEEYFEGKLEDEKKGLSEDLIEVVDSFTGSPADKLALVGKLKKGMGQTVNAPGSDRPSSNALQGDINSLVDQYQKADMKTKSAMIFELKARGDNVAKEVLQKI